MSGEKLEILNEFAKMSKFDREELLNSYLHEYSKYFGKIKYNERFFNEEASKSVNSEQAKIWLECVNDIHRNTLDYIGKKMKELILKNENYD